MIDAVELVVGSYVDNLCKGVKVATTKGVAYLLVGRREYPLIEGSVPPTLHIYTREGHLFIYSFWRSNEREHEAFIKASLTRVHLLKNGLLIEPHGTLEKFDAYVLIKLLGPRDMFNLLKRIINEEKFMAKEENGEVVSTYLEEYLKTRR
ncbi:hypothetical protein [Pyrococcus abyssi]|nr:hypothetical protein [Pyrococcus abyssi]CCE69450.1 TPA: hypothetical protein PAB0038 [Pyrococcus abyssi GE5]